MSKQVEFWCAAEVVTVAKWRRMSPLEQAPYIVKVRAGDFFVLPDGTIMEPLSEHKSQEEAMSAAVVYTQRTGKAARVVINADMSSTDAVDAITRRGALMG